MKHIVLIAVLVTLAIFLLLRRVVMSDIATDEAEAIYLEREAAHCRMAPCDLDRIRNFFRRVEQLNHLQCWRDAGICDDHQGCDLYREAVLLLPARDRTPTRRAMLEKCEALMLRSKILQFDDGGANMIDNPELKKPWLFE